MLMESGIEHKIAWLHMLINGFLTPQTNELASLTMFIYSKLRKLNSKNTRKSEFELLGVFLKIVFDRHEITPS